MNIQVEYRNLSGQGTKSNYEMTFPAFIKHLAVSGMGYMPRLNKIFRGIGIFFSYYPFINEISHKFPFAYKFLPYNSHYPSLADPTERGHFSNLVGKAISDFLAKRIDKAIITLNYEAVMKNKSYPINGPRPDLIAFKNNNERFSIEAKGLSKASISDNDMK